MDMLIGFGLDGLSITLIALGDSRHPEDQRPGEVEGDGDEEPRRSEGTACAMPRVVPFIVRHCDVRHCERRHGRVTTNGWNPD